MKSLRLLAAALLACAFAASAALACDAHKSANGAPATAATAVSASKTPGTVGAGCSAEAVTYKKASGTSAKAAAAGCTAEMAAACTPAMKAACESNPNVAAAMGCTTMGTTATAAAASAKPAAKMDDCCAMKAGKTGTAAVTASNGKGMSAEHCADAKGTSAMAAGMKCSAHANSMVHDCSACEDWMACEQEVRSLGARAQVVSLKNGAMIVYTADSPADVKTLQNVISKRHEKMLGALSGASGKTLCDECKSLRGAMASGKLHREVVNVEKGCMTLITSNDKDVVSKIRAMTGPQVAMR